MIPILFSTDSALAAFAKQRAQRGVYNGEDNARNRRLIGWCVHLLIVSPIESARIIYTRDVGHHESGWWKNPDYERCFHLSISFCINPTDEPLPFNKKVAERIARAFWGDDARKAWIESPYTPEGKILSVHHYRLFCDPAWSPIIPRKEVYSKEDTPSHWRSFSELHDPSDDVDAPWLKAASI
jgi:hypothetical protein